MTDKIAFDLVSPERLVLSEDAEMVTIPGREGDMGIMAGHMALISTLRPGMIVVSGAAGGGNGRYFVSGGFAEVTAQKLTVLAEETVPVAELDAAALDARIESAEHVIGAAKNDMDHAKAQELLDFLKSLRTAV